MALKPRHMSPEVQNWGTSDPAKRTDVLQKFILKKLIPVFCAKTTTYRRFMFQQATPIMKCQKMSDCPLVWFGDLTRRDQSTYLPTDKCHNYVRRTVSSQKNSSRTLGRSSYIL